MEIVLTFLFLLLENPFYIYLPIPMVALGAPALSTNRAMVRTTISMRPLELCIWLAAKVISLLSFFISNLLIDYLFTDSDGGAGGTGAEHEQGDGEDNDQHAAFGAVHLAGGQSHFFVKLFHFKSPFYIVYLLIPVAAISKPGLNKINAVIV